VILEKYEIFLLCQKGIILEKKLGVILQKYFKDLPEIF